MILTYPSMYVLSEKHMLHDRTEPTSFLFITFSFTQFIYMPISENRPVAHLGALGGVDEGHEDEHHAGAPPPS